tara:strand:- start:2948 stop:4807 length:1860 start_codon:yes stop_codon:yes gene_type:complete
MLSFSANETNIEAYKWFKYEGRNVSVKNRYTNRIVQKGDLYGIRYGTRSQSRKAFLIFSDNVKADFNLTDKEADSLIRKSKKANTPKDLQKLLRESKTKRIRNQIEHARASSNVWDANRYKPPGRIPSPKNHGYKSSDFQWRKVQLPKLTVAKTQSKKHTFQRGEWIGLRFDSESRGGIVVDMRGIIFNVNSTVYDYIVESSQIVEKSDWPDFSYTAQHITQMAQERDTEDKVRRKTLRDKAKAERADKKSRIAEEKLKLRRTRLREEAELAKKRGEFKKAEEILKARADLGLDFDSNTAFEAFLRGSVLDNVDDNTDFDLGDEDSDIGVPVDNSEEDSDEETAEDSSKETEDGDKDKEDSENPEDDADEYEDREQEDPEEDVASRDSNNDGLMDSLDDAIDKERKDLEEAMDGGEDEQLDLEEDEELDADEEDEEPDGEDDDWDEEDDELEDGDDEDEGEDEDIDGTDGEDEDPDNTDTDAEDAEDAEDDSKDGVGADGDQSENSEDKKPDPDSKEVKEPETKVAVGDIVTFKADESDQRQFLVFEIVQGKKNAEVTNYLLFDINGDNKSYKIFRSSKNAKTKIEHHINVLRRATGAEMRKLYKIAQSLTLDRSPIIS